MPANRFKGKKLSKAMLAKSSAAWFKGKVGKASRGFKKGKLEPGKMFTFGYDAKHKKTLPYWDRFPLIIVLDVVPQGFLGLNFHYLHPKERELFLKKLSKFETGAGKSKTFNVTWNAVKRIKGADKMIHKYLYTQVRTTLLESPPNEWENVIHLPYQKFVGESASTVWSN
jgi:hypothetical protein